ncbi:Septum formation protein Maf [Olavius algarvensis associated proteobacterium Delta 3]|nr:Septum formation protein Maf [Olavius algarvensis associated proteobacterium Delta 3]
MFENQPPGLILASQSPRRKYLLEQAGLKFEVIPSDFNENSVSLSDPDTYVTELAEGKAASVAGNYPESWVIGADTIVWSQGKVLGKPGSEDDARNMLRRLSGRTHQVYTGYAFVCSSRGRTESKAVRTDVLFKKLSDTEIDWYVHTGEPFDKAGAYAIQGIGTFLVRSITGSYTNVVGLPVCEVIEFLLNEKIVGFKIDN